mgnify:CR=1 FL=1
MNTNKQESVDHLTRYQPEVDYSRGPNSPYPGMEQDDEGEYVKLADIDALRAADEARVQAEEITWRDQTIVALSEKLSTAEARIAELESRQNSGEPVAYLRWWASQTDEGHGNIGHNEWFEVCEARDHSIDGTPAFPVFAAQPQQAQISDNQIDDIARKYAGLGGIEDYRAFARDIAAVPQQAQQAVVPELLAAADAVVARWDSPKWKDEAPTVDYIARLRRAAAACRSAAPVLQARELEGDPLDMVLPCDIKIGAMMIRKGCKLRTLVTRAESLHRMLMKHMPEPNADQKAAFDELLGLAHQASTQEGDSTGAVGAGNREGGAA